jgi:anti-sigma-K factor RskA
MSVEKHVSELLPAYALDILDEPEAKAVSSHLAGCDSCRAELHAYRQVVRDIPLAMVQVDPPANLKKRILQQAASTKNLAEAQPSRNWWQELKVRLLPATPVWGVVSLVLIVLLGASNLLLWQRLNQVEGAQNRLATVPLTGTDFTPSATGMLVISADGEHGTLVVDGLPVLDDTQQYQLWLIRDGQRTSGGVFAVDDEGYGSLWISSAEPLISYQGVGITVEPAGGSPAPTGERVMGGEL